MDFDTKHREHRPDAFEHVRLTTGVSAFGGSCVSCMSIINLISAATGTRTTRRVELKRSSPDWGVIALSGRVRVVDEGLWTAERLLEVNSVCTREPYTVYRMEVPVASHFRTCRIQGLWVSSGKRSCIPVRCILVQRLIALQMRKCRWLVKIVATIFRQAYAAGHAHASADGVLAAFSSGSHETPRVVLVSVVGSQAWGGAPLIARWCCSPLWNGSGMVGAYQRASRSLAVCLMYRLAVQHASRNANRRKHAAARPDPRQLPFWRPALRLRRLRPACSVGCSPWAWFQIARACPHRAWRRHTRNVATRNVATRRCWPWSPRVPAERKK